MAMLVTPRLLDLGQFLGRDIGMRKGGGFCGVELGVL